MCYLSVVYIFFIYWHKLWLIKFYILTDRPRDIYIVQTCLINSTITFFKLITKLISWMYLQKNKANQHCKWTKCKTTKTDDWRLSVLFIAVAHNWIFCSRIFGWQRQFRESAAWVALPVIPEMGNNLLNWEMILACFTYKQCFICGQNVLHFP